ncbi:hypothetical protein BH23DEI1_BH23DEI1_24530 [soil metagenome]
MHRADEHPRHQPSRFLRLVLLLVAASLLSAPALAQRLAGYLPADTFFAIGTVGLDAHADLLDDLLTEWERLDLGEKLEGALAGAGALGATFGVPLDEDLPDAGLPGELEGLEPLDLIGAEAWVALSISPFNPLPVLTLVASIDDATSARFDALLLEASAQPGAVELNEGQARFVVTPAGDGVPLAASRFGDLLALSTNPDVLRGVLRQAQGSSDPSFDDADGYLTTLGTLGDGAFYGYLDVVSVSDALAPLAAGLGFDASVARLSAMFATFGSGAGVIRVTPDGTESEGIQVLRGDGGDLALFSLLTRSHAAPRDLLRAVPERAFSVQVANASPAAWWDYLVDLVAGLPELGIRDPERMLRDTTGVDLRRDLFSWTGSGVMTLTTGFGAAVDPGIPSEALLGESVFVLVAADESAARAGLTRLFEHLGATVSMFTDPMAQGGPVPTRTRMVEGVEVTSFDLFPGAGVSVAVTGGLAVIGTTDDGTDATVTAILRGGDLAPTLARLLPDVPANATGFLLTDDRAGLEGTADQLAAQVRLLAGMGGGAALDFDAVVEATDALEEFLAFVASRLGGSVSWSVVDGAVIRTFGRSEVAWR